MSMVTSKNQFEGCADGASVAQEERVCILLVLCLHRGPALIHGAHTPESADAEAVALEVWHGDPFQKRPPNVSGVGDWKSSPKESKVRMRSRCGLLKLFQLLDSTVVEGTMGTMHTGITIM
eukprot:CAMPEP_0170600220 /NCGR_PEP_ID=MMETSP0224-20130122/17220_1 /TAXON_ID=285029 /ORGANISM="Togula jolla, Strain CCCM 725" /LENGTH=120 /DNA_ID=CAMNT_0010924935 /DNA_START=240 /DNA_END=603 /DNA_ORIENTATION=-